MAWSQLCFGKGEKEPGKDKGIGATSNDQIPLLIVHQFGRLLRMGVNLAIRL